MAGSNAPSSSPLPTSSIESLRVKDEKGRNGEIIPEKESFNSSKVLNFLRGRGITNLSVEKDFSLDLGLAITDENPTNGEKEIHEHLNEAKIILQKYNRLDVMEEKSLDVVKRQIDNLKSPPTNMTAMEAGKVLQAFEYFSLIRDYSRRLLVSEAKIKDDRAAEKKQVDVMGSIQEKLGEAKDRWDEWDTGKKLAFGALAILGGAWFLKTDNEMVKKIREGLKTLAIGGAGAWVLNNAVELFTGHTAVDWVFDKTKASTKEAKFYVENFHTNEEGAQILSKSFTMLDNEKFVDSDNKDGLLDKYVAAKADGSHKIDGLKMKPEEAYRALDIFITRFGNNPELLRKQYEKSVPPISYSQVAADQMARDPGIKLADNIATKAYDVMSDNFKEGYNYLATTSPAIWLGKKYRDWFGKEPNKLEMDDFVKKFSNIAKDDLEYEKVIENKLAAGDRMAGINFKDTLRSGTPDAKYGLKHKLVNNYLYVIAERPIGTQITDKKFVDQNIQSSVNDTESFLSNKYSVNVIDVPKKTEVFGSVYVADKSVIRYLVRYKVA